MSVSGLKMDFSTDLVIGQMMLCSHVDVEAMKLILTVLHMPPVTQSNNLFVVTSSRQRPMGLTCTYRFYLLLKVTSKSVCCF